MAYEPQVTEERVRAAGLDPGELVNAARELVLAADLRSGPVVDLTVGDEQYFDLYTFTNGAEIGQFDVTIPERQPDEDDDDFMTRCFDVVAIGALRAL